MLLNMTKNKEFRKRYLEIIKYKLTNGNLGFEYFDEKNKSFDYSLDIMYQLDAISYIFQNQIKLLSHYDFTNLLCEIASKVSGGEITNFRNTAVVVEGSKIERSDPKLIRSDLWYLIDDYKYMLENTKNDEEKIQVEAKFHIRLLHIHPFEDTNGRTARIILTYNMMKNGIPPSIITDDIKTEYCQLIENYDYIELSKLFSLLSKREEKIMINLYNQLNLQGIFKENQMTENQEEKYNDIINSKSK